MNDWLTDWLIINIVSCTPEDQVASVTQQWHHRWLVEHGSWNRCVYGGAEQVRQQRDRSSNDPEFSCDCTPGCRVQLKDNEQHCNFNDISLEFSWAGNKHTWNVPAYLHLLLKVAVFQGVKSFEFPHPLRLLRNNASYWLFQLGPADFSMSLTPPGRQKLAIRNPYSMNSLCMLITTNVLR